MNYIDLKNWASYVSIALRQRHNKNGGLVTCSKTISPRSKHINRTTMIRFNYSLCRVSVLYKYLLYLFSDDIFHMKPTIEFQQTNG